MYRSLRSASRGMMNFYCSENMTKPIGSTLIGYKQTNRVQTNKQEEHHSMTTCTYVCNVTSPCQFQSCQLSLADENECGRVSHISYIFDVILLEGSRDKGGHLKY